MAMHPYHKAFGWHMIGLTTPETLLLLLLSLMIASGILETRVALLLLLMVRWHRWSLWRLLLTRDGLLILLPRLLAVLAWLVRAWIWLLLLLVGVLCRCHCIYG